MSGVGTQKEKNTKLGCEKYFWGHITYLASLDMLFKILLILPFSVTNSHVKWAIYPSIWVLILQTKSTGLVHFLLKRMKENSARWAGFGQSWLFSLLVGISHGLTMSQNWSNPAHSVVHGLLLGLGISHFYAVDSPSSTINQTLPTLKYMVTTEVGNFTLPFPI
jgi:hypothetical protein